MYLDEVPEGQTREDLALVIEEVLKQRIQGVKNEKGVWITPAFPKLIYVLEEDNIREDSKYWNHSLSCTFSGKLCKVPILESSLILSSSSTYIA